MQVFVEATGAECAPVIYLQLRVGDASCVLVLAVHQPTGRFGRLGMPVR